MWCFGLVDEIDKKAKRTPGIPPQKKSTVKRVVGPCEGCEIREILGCGFLGLKGHVKRTHVDATLDLVGDTCPEYYARQVSVLEVHEYYGDYKRGSLGDVRKLSAPLLEGLRILESEFSAFEASLI